MRLWIMTLIAAGLLYALSDQWQRANDLEARLSTCKAEAVSASLRAKVAIGSAKQYRAALAASAARVQEEPIIASEPEGWGARLRRFWEGQR